MVHDYHDWLYDKPGMFEIYVEIGCDDIYHQINHGYYWYCPHWLPLGLTPRGLKKSIDQQLWTKDADGDGALSRSSAARKQERNTSGSWRDWELMDRNFFNEIESNWWWLMPGWGSLGFAHGALKRKHLSCKDVNLRNGCGCWSLLLLWPHSAWIFVGGCILVAVHQMLINVDFRSIQERNCPRYASITSIHCYVSTSGPSSSTWNRPCIPAKKYVCPWKQRLETKHVLNTCSNRCNLQAIHVWVI